MKKMIMNSLGNITEFECEEEMTLRDYFAAKAMQSIITDGKLGKLLIHDHYIKKVSEMSYEYADAMMEARK
jgi:hypothetical protein